MREEVREGLGSVLRDCQVQIYTRDLLIALFLFGSGISISIPRFTLRACVTVRLRLCACTLRSWLVFLSAHFGYTLSWSIHMLCNDKMSDVLSNSIKMK